MLDRIAATPVLESAGYTVVPSLFAYAVPGGPLREDDFRSFHRDILHALEEALGAGSVDGVWLYLHGALEVQGVGSGEAALVTSIRSRVGDDVPIAVALDFHANNTHEMIAAASIVYGYRTAPHVDVEETQIRAAELLVDAMQSGTLPRAVMVSIPMLIPGEMATTPVEPLYSLMPELSRAEEVPEISCASFFDGMAWVDAPHSRASIVVVERRHPGDRGNVGAAAARRLAKLFWARRAEFGFEEETAGPEEAIRLAVAASRGPVFIADSGDNFTAGAPGDSIWYLRMLLDHRLPPTLVAGITCGRAVRAVFESHPEDAALELPINFSLDLGGELDPNGDRLELECEIRWIGRVLDKSGEANTRAVRARAVANPSVEVLITEDRVSFTSPRAIESAGSRLDEYHIVVVKLGYLFDALRQVAARSIMALTPGAACQDMSAFTYKRVRRPLYPLDRGHGWDPGDG
jgi:microcystin degradation protein MlrC